MTEYVLVVSLVSATVWAVFATWDIWGWGETYDWQRTSGEGRAHLSDELDLDDLNDAPPASPAASPEVAAGDAASEPDGGSVGGNGGGAEPPPTEDPVPEPAAAPYVPPFSVGAGGGIALASGASPEIRILGSAITYGAGGPQVPVSLTVTVDGSPNELFKGTGSQITSATKNRLGDLPGGTNIHFSGKSFSPYNRNNVLYSQSTTTNSQMIIALRNGDLVPDKTPFGQQPQIKSFLTEVIDPASKQVTIGDNQVLYLMELGTNNTSSAAADFQDLVFLVSF